MGGQVLVDSRHGVRGGWAAAARVLAALALLPGLLLPLPAGADSLPTGLRGAWRITRVLPTSNMKCWGPEQAAALVGSGLVYSSRALRWKGGTEPLTGVLTRRVSSEEFAEENMGSDGYKLGFAQLGLPTRELTEVDLQHADADVLPASTGVPGDVVLMVAPEKIIVSACGVYFEARRSR